MHLAAHRLDVAPGAGDRHRVDVCGVQLDAAQHRRQRHAQRTAAAAQVDHDRGRGPGRSGATSRSTTDPVRLPDGPGRRRAPPGTPCAAAAGTPPGRPGSAARRTPPSPGRARGARRRSGGRPGSRSWSSSAAVSCSSRASSSAKTQPAARSRATRSSESTTGSVSLAAGRTVRPQAALRTRDGRAEHRHGSRQWPEPLAARRCARDRPATRVCASEPGPQSRCVHQTLRPAVGQFR